VGCGFTVVRIARFPWSFVDLITFPWSFVGLITFPWSFVGLITSRYKQVTLMVAPRDIAFAHTDTTFRTGEKNMAWYYRNPCDERFRRVWRGSYSFTLEGVW
jgi:hypothetical protein